MKELYRKYKNLERENESLRKELEAEKRKTPKKLNDQIEELERKNKVLKDSLEFLHEKHPFLWGETNSERNEEL